MSQHYSDTRRADDPYSLPDVEIWQAEIVTVICHRCGSFDVPDSAFDAVPEKYCPSCERELDFGDADDEGGPDSYVRTGKDGWFYWFCFPGCLPEGEPEGPYATEAEALAAAREGCEDGADDDEGEN